MVFRPTAKTATRLRFVQGRLEHSGCSVLNWAESIYNQKMRRFQ